MGYAPPSDAVSVRTFNRNFPGRSGTPSDQVYLTTPTVAAATALYGAITDPRELGEYPDLPEAPMYPAVDDAQILAPAPEDEADKIEVPRGPNIHEPPEAEELPDDFTGTVAIVLPDDVSTGDLSPDGVEVMAFRSNVPELAKYTLRRFDPEFPDKAQEWAPAIIVGGENYGQGSSREHAALAPLHLGVRAVIAKGFARIHRRNLVAQGIMPLLFKNEEDYDKFEEGQEVTLPDIREHLQNGDTEVPAQMNGTEVTLLAQFSERERNMLIDGGFRRQLRQGQEEEAPEGGEFKDQSEPPSERDAEQGGEMS
jgi:aconitate hydratase